MKRHKAPGLSGLVAEMIQATGDIGIQWILDLCNGIVKEGSILRLPRCVCVCGGPLFQDNLSKPVSER